MAIDLVTLTQPRSAAAEAYRTLRTNLMFSNADANLKRVGMTSPSTGEHKSIALANLAVTLAQADHKTLIVDADLRLPEQHTLWGIDAQSGLTDMLIKDSAFDAPPIQNTSVEGLHILPSGTLPANPADVLASSKMEQAIDRLSTEFDYVLFDLPPVLVASDASVLGRKLDGVLLVIKARATRRDHAQKAKDQLERVHANLIGMVLTNAPQATQNAYQK